MADTSYTNAEDAYNDQDAIKTRVNDRKDRWKNGREVFLRAAYRNILFYRGLQWIKWDRGMGRWRSAKLPHNTPTPVTNVFASTMDALISVFARIEPALNFRPGMPDQPDDRASADVAVRAMNVVEDEVNIRLWRQVLATWVGLTGMAWLETGYDPSPQWGTRFIPTQQCLACGQTQTETPPCQACGSPQMQPATDPMTGAPMGETYPIGRMYVDVVTLFEMFFDASIPVWSRQREWIREKSVTVDDSKARWPNIADSIQANVTESTPAYAEQLPLTGPPIDENQTGRLGLSMRGQNTRVTERWYWSLPDAKYPDGLLAVIVGQDLVAYAGPLPYSAPPEEEGQSRKYFLPAVCFPQKLVPGSGYAKTVADDLAPKQAQRNRWESMLEACGFRMGAPVWLKPNGANITNMTGDPGNIISYNAVGPNAAKPERIPGQPIPMSMIEMIHDIDKSFEELAATFDVIKGARPEGVSAGIALQILQERNLSRYGPLFILWEQSWAEWARQALEIFREFATEPRLLRIRGRDGQWQVEKFMGADLQGSIDIVPEAASSLPRSSLLDKAEMEQLAAMRIIDINDPEVKYKFLEIYGRTNLTPAMALDTKNAIMENEEFEKLAANPMMAQASPQDIAAAQRPEMTYLMLQDFFLQTFQINIPKVRASIDDHAIHAREMRNKCKSESFRAWPELVQIVAEKHAEYHQQLLLASQQALAAQQMPQGGFMGMGGGAPSPMRGASGGNAMQGQMHELAETVANGGQHSVAHQA